VNGQPAKTANYLKWSTNGASDNDLIFVSGHPGRTGRLLTMDQLGYLRDDEFPLRLSSYTRRLDAIQKFSSESEENARERILRILSDVDTRRAAAAAAREGEAANEASAEL